MVGMLSDEEEVEDLVFDILENIFLEKEFFIYIRFTVDSWIIIIFAMKNSSINITIFK